LVSVAVDPTTATFAIDGGHGLGRLVDGGDVGDTYNWCPPDGDVEVDAPEPGTVSVALDEPGPLRGRLHITATYRWRNTPTNVRTTVELRAGERAVRVTHAFENRERDHRLRAWFALPAPARVSRAECAFAVVERGLTAEGGPTELGLPTFPSRRFVQAGGLTLAHEGLLEYELVDIDDSGTAAHALALTLLRATGLLSQGPMDTRPLPAGPMDPAEAAQMQGPVEVRYAVAVGDDVDPYALADDVFVPLVVTKAVGGGPLPTEGSALAVAGAEVSAVRRTAVGGPLEVRVFNPTAEPVAVTVAGHHGWLVDLRGRPIEPFEDTFVLGPWSIATLVLNPRQ
ncbi:MAG: alpha-mannosidase, partial [Acidimicrobiales bacterium]